MKAATMLKTEAIKKFLYNSGYPLARQYNANMEVQVNVAKDGGDIIKGSYAGKQWQGYSDGSTTWKSFRIPWKAATTPEFVDKPITFDISKHTEAIGMTGWDYTNKCTKWVGFDFDSLIGHKEGLTSDDLTNIKNRLLDVSFVSIYTSTSGNGLHVYVYIENDDMVATHTEHAAVARAILDKISALSGIELQAKVDTLGGNMWVWHRNAGPGSYKEIRLGSSLHHLPANWQQYLTKTKLVHSRTTDQDIVIASHKQVTLDVEHRKLIQWFEDKDDVLWWWDSDKHMLVCHTYDLKLAKQQLGLVGYYDTVSTGKDSGTDQNCFCFPEVDGAWIVRRHTRGVREHVAWNTDTTGWTSIHYNRLPSVRSASNIMGGVEGEKSFYFKQLSDAVKCLGTLGIRCEIPPDCSLRKTELKQKEGKIILSFLKANTDADLNGWISKKNNWEQAFFLPKVIDDFELPDGQVRHLVANEAAFGWYVHSNNKWVAEGKGDVSNVLLSLGYRRPDIDKLLGKCILHHWSLVCKPFKPEYTGDREWNKDAPQLRFNAEEGDYEHWEMILQHLGKNLDDACQANDWCIENGITTGYLYLSTWIGSLIQNPTEPLPYLTFTGPQNCGKSIFHESLSILFSRGYVRADNSLINPSGFNGELANALLCVVEETDLSRRGYAGDRIKDWVTGRTISIRAMYKQPYDIPNYTHWIQCTNDPGYCPVFTGDTRIVMIEVDPIEQELPKPVLLQYCEREAPAFIEALINRTLPESKGRLAIPALETEHKAQQQLASKSEVSIFLEEKLVSSTTDTKFSEVYQSFIGWVGVDSLKWNKNKFSRELAKHGIKTEKQSDQFTYLIDKEFRNASLIG